MGHPLAPSSQIDQALEHGWTIVTANQRAARTLRYSFDRQQHASGLHTWHPPAVLALDTWLSSLWTRLLLDGRASALLLNPSQEHTLWRSILEADRRLGATASGLRPTDSLAELAAFAWHLLHAYRGRSLLRNFADTADTRAFVRWIAEFERRLARHNYLTQAQLSEALVGALSDGSLTPLPTGILLVGFDTKTPAQSALFEAIQAAGLEVENLRLKQLGNLNSSSALDTEPPTLVAAEDEYEELAACAHWIRTQLTQRPTLRIAVIVPDLEANRTRIDRAFHRILAPELEAISASTASGPFEFSLGIPLAQTPLVATALDILRWALAPLPIERISALLLSPHFAPADPLLSEHLARAEFDAFTLRRQHLLQPQLSLGKLLDLASRSSANLPALLKHLRTLRPLFSNRDLAAAERTHAEWAAVFSEILTATGWASTSNVDSTEFQTLRKWESALDELATLDFNPDLPRVPFATALAAFERIANQSLFSPESRHAPIQIMGPLESAGSTFDAIWFLHAGDLAWPATPSANPLLPWRLQRDLLMPGVDPAHDSAVARRITRRIAASAPIVVLSYARRASDSTQRPSPALADLQLEPSTAAQIASLDLPAQPIALEILHEEPLIPSPPDQVLQGGAAILQAQAACGFRAFAEKRLYSSALETRQLGLDPRERGSLVHDILERFWTEVETQAALKLLTPFERDGLLAHSIDESLARHIARADPGWNLAYLESERNRLLKLLKPWLELELKRSPFAVHSREAKLKDVSIGPLRLDVRVDRVDTLLIDNESAGDIILDYKTSFPKPGEWLGDRPDSPQLPLYAVVSESPNLAAVAFATIRAGSEMELTGYEAHKGILPKASRLKTPSLQAQVDDWRATLTTLAQDFYAGSAPVAPKQFPSTCRYCEQRLLCRLNLTTLEADAIEDFIEETDNTTGLPKESDAATMEAARG